MTSRSIRRRRFVAVAVILVIGGAVAAAVLASPTGPDADPERVYATDDPIERGCALRDEVLTRIARGHVPGRSEDITFVPHYPNYLGSFDVTSHSGPWAYLQEVPLVLYGPERVPETGPVERPVTLADVFPTLEDWTQTEVDDRTGTSLIEGVEASKDPPKLVVVVMWDGVGNNVLERWPDRWPTLRKIASEGVTYTNATVGSSPSITPATHATLGTGTFPDEHGISAIKYRGEDGIVTAFEGRDPRDLGATTFADEFDRALDNEPLVGLVGLRIWHIPMMGAGAAVDGGDKDHLGLIGLRGRVTGNHRFYETPGYLRAFSALQLRIDELDRDDGVTDGLWREHPIAESHDNPAWSRYETDVILELWEREGYGTDATTDLFFVNYKTTDVVGHQYSMDSPEMGDVLQAQDEELGRLLTYLDDNVGDYALVVSADHGHTPDPERSGAWPISPAELVRDLDKRFDVPDGEQLVEMNTAVGPFLDAEVLEQTGATTMEIARFLNGYSIRENWPEPSLPERFAERGDEPVFAAAFPTGSLPEVLACAGVDLEG